MKQLIKSVIITILILGSFLFVYNIDKAYCWDCTPKSCNYDASCDIGCWCYKGQYEIQGVCVTK